MELCRRCLLKEDKDEQILDEIAHADHPTIFDWLKQYRDGLKDGLREKVIQRVRERIKDQGLSSDDSHDMTSPFKSFVDRVIPQDIEDCLEEYVQQGDLEIEKGRIKITPKGGRKLARIARLKLVNMNKERKGPHKIRDTGYGLDLAQSTRAFTMGDDYRSFNLQKSLINAIERNAANGKLLRNFTLEPQDLQVYEKTYETRMCISLLIDESSSMGEEKRNAAMDTCLALASLREPHDLLKVFIFSSQIREIPWYEITNISAPGDITDIRLAMKTGRQALSKEKGDRQVYLITDAEPNSEDEKYVGFEKAIQGVRREALYYRRQGITLNIVMLEKKPVLKEFAAELARLNAGRIFFTSPDNLGRVVTQDYLSSKSH